MYHGHEEHMRHGEREGDCGCEGHGRHHEERSGERHEERGGDCGCGGHGHHGHHSMNREWHHHGGSCGCSGHGHGGMGWGGMPHEGCNCPCHRMGMGRFGMGMMGMHGGMGMGFGRRFISRDEIVSRLEEYLKELQSEAKAVEERIAEIKKRGEGA